MKTWECIGRRVGMGGVCVRGCASHLSGVREMVLRVNRTSASVSLAVKGNEGEVCERMWVILHDVCEDWSSGS